MEQCRLRNANAETLLRTVLANMKQDYWNGNSLKVCKMYSQRQELARVALQGCYSVRWKVLKIIERYPCDCWCYIHKQCTSTSVSVASLKENEIKQWSYWQHIQRSAHTHAALCHLAPQKSHSSYVTNHLGITSHGITHVKRRRAADSLCDKIKKNYFITCSLYILKYIVFQASFSASGQRLGLSLTSTNESLNEAHEDFSWLKRLVDPDA